jgi:hypothetical protein
MSKTFKQEKGKQITSLPVGYNCRIQVHENSHPVILNMFLDAAERMKTVREEHGIKGTTTKT